MKKIVVLVSLLIAAAGCTTTPTGNSNMTANANSNANRTGETKSTGAVSESDIIAKEKGAWDAIKKKDWDGFGKTLASDYLEVLDDGVHDKAMAVSSLKDFDLTDVTFADWKMTPIDKDAVIITYNATVKANFKGQAVPAGPYREASVYVNRNGEWLAAFYQETISRTAPPSSPSPAPTAPKKEAAASPSAKAGEPGPDPIANEKMVWDTFKNRSYDVFASYLASDFMEVEPDGVFDKAGSVKALSSMDVAKFQLSDWKALKFDNDAALVTYVVTAPGPKPEKEYHSTIWVNRDGKWLGLFHQGTPAGTAAASAKPEMKKM